MPFLEHLEELRKRVIRSALAVVVFAIIAFYFSDYLIAFLIAPLGGIKLHVTEVTGSFSAYMRVSIIAGILFALPVIFHQLWGFVSPGLYKKERSKVVPLVLISTVLFLVGCAFCYYLVLPFALKFLIEFSGGQFSPIITVGSYISFSGMLLLAFGLGFEIPVAAYLLGKMGVITAGFLSRGRRIAIVVILIVAAVLTPTPDVFTQLLLAIPLYILYEVSILIVWLTQRKPKVDTES